jgi:hypothetical protein
VVGQEEWDKAEIDGLAESSPIPVRLRLHPDPAGGTGPDRDTGVSGPLKILKKPSEGSLDSAGGQRRLMATPTPSATSGTVGTGTLARLDSLLRQLFRRQLISLEDRAGPHTDPRLSEDGSASLLKALERRRKQAMMAMDPLEGTGEADLGNPHRASGFHKAANRAQGGLRSGESSLKKRRDQGNRVDRSAAENPKKQERDPRGRADRSAAGNPMKQERDPNGRVSGFKGAADPWWDGRRTAENPLRLEGDQGTGVLGFTNGAADVQLDGLGTVETGLERESGGGHESVGFPHNPADLPVHGLERAVHLIQQAIDGDGNVLSLLNKPAGQPFDGVGTLGTAGTLPKQGGRTKEDRGGRDAGDGLAGPGGMVDPSSWAGLCGNENVGLLTRDGIRWLGPATNYAATSPSQASAPRS